MCLIRKYKQFSAGLRPRSDLREHGVPPAPVVCFSAELTLQVTSLSSVSRCLNRLGNTQEHTYTACSFSLCMSEAEGGRISSRQSLPLLFQEDRENLITEADCTLWRYRCLHVRNTVWLWALHPDCALGHVKKGLHL